MSLPVIRAENIAKKYGDFVAVDGISFEVQRGESFGLLGPNGAGKSTTMKMIAAVSTRTSGTLEVLGMDPNTDGPAIRSQLGVVPQEDNLDQELRVRENLITYGRFFGMSHAAVAKRARHSPRPRSPRRGRAPCASGPTSLCCLASRR